MSRIRSRIILPAGILLLAALVGAFLPSPDGARRAYAQTVPTITPTPDEEPTSRPGPTSPPAPTEAGTTPAQQPTATRQPVRQATATRPAGSGTVSGRATPPAILSPLEAAWPTAEPCSLDPTTRVRAGGAWVYEGPGEDYERIGRLEEDTVRPILARAAGARWWLVQLEEDESGWIADADVDVQGDTTEVAIEETPALPDGETPTPGPTWEPTPNADCSTPAARPTATPTLRATPTPEEAEEAEETATPVLVATDEVEPLPVEEEEGSSLMWLPVTGLVLLAAAALLYVTRRS